MNGQVIFYPVLAHLFLVISLYFLMAARKSKADKAKEVDRKKAALDNKAWPDYVLVVSNNLANQYEAPILFYVVCIVSYVTNSVTDLTIWLACGYCALRYLHSYVQISSNYVPHRMAVFSMSLLVLLVMLIQTAISII